jgi:prepilin-type N-terminal cleavage/methylation domain-containing protein
MQGQPSNRRGFTLIELLVVIAIVMILAGITVPALRSARDSARKAKSVANLRAMGVSILRHAAMNHGRLPSLAGAGDAPYAPTPELRAFFAENDLSPRLAYSPANPSLINESDEWITHTWQVPALIWLPPIDNNDQTAGGEVLAVTWLRDDEDAGFATGTGTWNPYSGPGTVQGSQARYSDTPDAKSTWTFDVPAGNGTLQLQALVRKGPDAHDNVVYEIEARDSDVGNPQTVSVNLRSATETFEWITLGSFAFSGGNRKVSVKSIGEGSMTPLPAAEIVIDNEAGSPQIAATGTWTWSNGRPEPATIRRQLSPRWKYRKRQQELPVHSRYHSCR